VKRQKGEGAKRLRGLPFYFLTVYVATLVFLTLANTDAKELDYGAIKGRVIAKNPRWQKDAIVYIDRVEGDFPPPKEHAIMDQKNLIFIPHVLPILVGTMVDFHNSDTIPHNVYSPDEVAGKMNLGTWRKGEKRAYVFNKLGSAAILCHVHPEMEAYIVILQNPHFAVTKKNGKFFIENVPAGQYHLKVWHKFLKAEDVEIEVKKGETIKVNFNLSLSNAE
jgi:plastocyanin